MPDVSVALFLNNTAGQLIQSANIYAPQSGLFTVI
jgi:hypothetical protein